MVRKNKTHQWNPAVIKLLRGKRTQEEFARLLGAPKNTIWRWEAGYAVPAAAYVKKLAHLAGQERFLSDWEPVGSITWVGDLEEGSRQIALRFSRVVAKPGRSALKSGRS